MEQEIFQSTAYKAAVTYETFFVAGIFHYWTPLLIQRAAPQPNEQALDVACGTGVVARSIVPLVQPNGRVAGLDINPAMLEVACRQFADNCDQIEWREGGAEEMPFDAETFDLVTCQQGLQFFKNKPAAAREMKRVLKDGGRAVIAVWQSLASNLFFNELDTAISAVYQVPLADISSPHSYGDPEVLENLLKEGGFPQVTIEVVEHGVRFREIDRFVELIIRSKAAVVPAFTQIEAAQQEEYLRQVTHAVSGLLEQNSHNGALTFPMTANFAVAIR